MPGDGPGLQHQTDGDAEVDGGLVHAAPVQRSTAMPSQTAYAAALAAVSLNARLAAKPVWVR